jgi:hypothetical protein
LNRKDVDAAYFFLRSGQHSRTNHRKSDSGDRGVPAEFGQQFRMVAFRKWPQVAVSLPITA